MIQRGPAPGKCCHAGQKAKRSRSDDKHRKQPRRKRKLTQEAEAPLPTSDAHMAFLTEALKPPKVVVTPHIRVLTSDWDDVVDLDRD